VLRVTADSNIYISALNFGGTPDKVLDLAREGQIELAISDAILNEVVRVLSDKFGWSQEAAMMAREQISCFARQVIPDRVISIVADDPTDNRILECAAAGESGFVVTGDKHLLRLERFESTRILTPSEFLTVQFGAG
jgi:putative PIN family toxin of toxin-antitoxin system